MRQNFATIIPNVTCTKAPEEEYKIKVTVWQVLLSIIFFGMILAILSKSKEASLSFVS